MISSVYDWMSWRYHFKCHPAVISTHLKWTKRNHPWAHEKPNAPFDFSSFHCWLIIIIHYSRLEVDECLFKKKWFVSLVRTNDAVGIRSICSGSRQSIAASWTSVRWEFVYYTNDHIQIAAVLCSCSHEKNHQEQTKEKEATTCLSNNRRIFRKGSVILFLDLIVALVASRDTLLSIFRCVWSEFHSLHN